MFAVAVCFSLLTFFKQMRQELLNAYWDVVRDGVSCKEPAERPRVNRGQLWKICNTSVISRPVGRPGAFDELD